MDASKRLRLTRLLGMIGSDGDGEALNAARMAQRLIGSEGLTWEEVLNSSGPAAMSDADMRRLFDAGHKQGYKEGYETGSADAKGTSFATVRRPTWVSFAKDIRDQHGSDINDWEEGFIDNYIDRGWANPTPKQRAVFERMADKLGLELPD